MSLRRFLTTVVFLFLFVASTHASNTHGTPDTQGEMQAWFGDGFAAYVHSGCLPAVPSSSLTFGAFACQGYVRGALADLVYVSQPAISLTVTGVTGLHWIAIHRDTSSVVANWTRRSGSHYLFRQYDPAQPADPIGGLVVARVTVAGGVITAVYPTANPNPVLSTAVGAGKNVKECGAKVDGVTDDTVALNVCLAAYPHVFVPAGILKHTAAIVINIGNHLSGVQQGLWDADGSAAPGARVQGSTLLFTGTGAAIRSANNITITSCQCEIDHLLIRSSSATSTLGIHMLNVEGVYIHDNMINGQSEEGVVAAGFTVAGIWIDGGGGGADPATTTSRIERNDIRYVVGTGILLQGVNNINGMDFIGNQILGCGGYGIQGVDRTRGIRIIGGAVQGCGLGQIVVTNKGEGWTIATYVEASAGATTPFLIWLRMCAGCTIQNTTFQGSGSGLMDAAIKLGEASAGFVPQGIAIIANKFDSVAQAVNIDAVWNLDYKLNSRGLDVPLECGGTHANSRQLVCIGGTILNDTFPGVTPIETVPIIQSATNVLISAKNTVAETTLFTTTIPAYALQSSVNDNGSIVLDFSASLINNTGAPHDALVKIYYGTAVVGQLNWLAIASGAIRALSIEGSLSPVVGFGVNRMRCRWSGDLGPPGSAAGSPTDAVSLASVRLVEICNVSSATTVNMALDQTFKVTVTLSVADNLFEVVAQHADIIRKPY